MNVNTFRKFYHRPTKQEGKRLDMAERPLDFHPNQFNNFLNTLSQEDFICYPSEKDYESLNSKIADLNGIQPDQICLGAGSDSLIKNFFAIKSRRSSYFLSSFPCFPMYSVYGEMFDIYMEKIEFDKYLNISIDFITAKTNRECSFIVLANPNSPFGDYKNEHQLRYLLTFLKAFNVPLLLDEAYVDFAPSSYVQLINEFDNLFVLKTFSKAWGGAGVRCGYICSQANNIKDFRSIRDSFVLTGPTIKYIGWLIDNKQSKDQYVADVIEQKNKIDIELKDKYEIINGYTNWLHIRGNNSIQNKLDFLKISYKKDIEIPHHGKGWMRICVFNGLFNFLKYD